MDVNKRMWSERKKRDLCLSMKFANARKSHPWNESLALEWRAILLISFATSCRRFWGYKVTLAPINSRSSEVRIPMRFNENWATTTASRRSPSQAL